jgi:hypothetical protein
MIRAIVLPTTINRPGDEPILVFHPLMHPGEPLEIDGVLWRVRGATLTGDETGARQTLDLDAVTP